jgi:hypothetical protein
MALDSEATQDAEWTVLGDQIANCLDRFGRKDAFRNGDYWLVDDNWGWRRHQLEIQNLKLLSPEIVKSLQRLLTEFPKWTISIRIDVPGTEQIWPAMGLIIHREEIVDQLQRVYLPDEFRNTRF